MSSAWYADLGNQLTDAQLFEKTVYRGGMDNFCYLYPTTITTKRLSVLGLDEGTEVLQYALGGTDLWVLATDYKLYDIGVNATKLEPKSKLDVGNSLQRSGNENI